MNPWITLTIIMAAIIFGIDFLLRRKKWNDNSTEEKISLQVNMFSAGIYTFLSVLGMPWGKEGNLFFSISSCMIK